MGKKTSPGYWADATSLVRDMAASVYYFGILPVAVKNMRRLVMTT